MSFQIPVVLFIFKRYETVFKILDVLRKAGISKLYLVGDGPRNKEEEKCILECREKIEDQINWPCEVIKDYATTNRGVYENIGKGAIRVFEHESRAIFLEDDNLPELSFFEYCKQLLDKYEDNDKVLWINGTNYLTEYNPVDGADYMFTRQLLPCGWASWRDKFCKYYDGELVTTNNSEKLSRFKNSYKSKLLYSQQFHSIMTTKRKLEVGDPVSWDFQMCFSLRSNGMFGISPKYNQIKNIGVDENSTHGGTSMTIEMTNRFCGMSSQPLIFPLKDPKKIEVDEEYEKKIEKIITWPMSTQIKYRICYFIKPFLGLNKYDSMSLYLKRRKKRGKNEKNSN